jgi:putative glutamine amidotransferase
MRPVSGTTQLTSPRADTAVRTVRLAGVGADVLLPGDWHRYARTLDAARVFAHTGFQQLTLDRDAPAESPRAPRIGILVSEPAALHGALGVATLIKDVRSMGAVPLLVPPCADLAVAPHEREAAMQAMIDRLDGVIGPGGADVSPRLYGERATHSEATNHARDRFEGDFAALAMLSDVFMLGICRSHQLWNAVRGGKNVQDLQKDGVVRLSQRQTDFGLPKDRPFVLQSHISGLLFEHKVEITPAAALASIAGANALLTNSFHHQAVLTPGRGLTPVATVLDPHTGARTIEATEGRNVLTVQWHPELMPADATQRRILETVGRRAHAIYIVKTLRAAGVRDERALLDHMRRSGVDFDAGDRDFARSMLIPHPR